MFKFSNKYLKNERFKLLIYLILIIFISITTVLTTFLMGLIIDNISLHKNINSVIKLSLLFFWFQLF